MECVRYGVIGCGMMGREHLNNISLLQNEGARVTVIFDPDESSRDLCKEMLPEAEFVTSISELLSYSPLDCLVIASPNHKHIYNLRQIYQKWKDGSMRRALPILCEKPLATTLEDVTEILQKFGPPFSQSGSKQFPNKYPAPLWVGMEYRYMPPIGHFIQKMNEITGGVSMIAIREHRFPFLPKVGDWNRFSANTGGTLVEKCCHFFDLMRKLIRVDVSTPSPSPPSCSHPSAIPFHPWDPVRVYATASAAHNHLNESYNGVTPDISDHAFAIVTFRSGVSASLDLCMFAEGSRYQEEICCVGGNGKVEVFLPGPERMWPSDTLGSPPLPLLTVSPRYPKNPVTTTIEVDEEALKAGDHNGATFFQHARFLEVVKKWRERERGGRKEGEEEQWGVEVDVLDGWWAVVMGLAAEESSRCGETIHIPKFVEKFLSTSSKL